MAGANRPRDSGTHRQLTAPRAVSAAVTNVKAVEMNREQVLLTRDRAPRNADRFALALSAVLAAGGVILRWEEVAGNPAVAVVSVLFALVAASVRIDVGSVSTGLTMGMGNAALATMLTVPAWSDQAFGLWTFGVILACFWSLNTIRSISWSMITEAAAGLALLAAYETASAAITRTTLSSDLQVVISLGAAFCAYFLVTVVEFSFAACIQNRAGFLRSFRGISWGRALSFTCLQYVIAVFAATLAYAWGTRFDLGLQSQDLQSLLMIVLAVATSSVFALGVRSRRWASRDATMMEALASLPWEATTSVEDQAVQYLQRAIKPFRTQIVDSQNDSAPAYVEDGCLISSPIDHGDDAKRIRVSRRAWQRPYTQRDVNMIEAMATMARESLRADRELRRLQSFSNTDSLTGLMNYRALRSSLSTMAERNSKCGMTALLFLNVQNLSHINEDYSSEAGDDVLKAVAQRLRSAAPSGSTIARIAGDEFVVLMSGIDERREAEDKAFSIYSAVTTPVLTSDGMISLNISQGVSLAGTETSDIQQLISRADEHLYRARRKFIDKVEPDDVQLAADSEALVNGGRVQEGLSAALADAIRSDRVMQVYQPVVNRVNANIIGLEVGLRFSDSGPASLPERFIREESGRLGLASQLASQVLRRAVDDVRRFQVLAPDLHRVSVNISVAQLVDRDFRTVYEEVAEANPDVEVFLELDERSIRLAPLETIEKASQYVTAHGIRLVVDNLGTDYSELTAIVDYPLTAMKVSSRIMDESGKERTRIALAKLLELGASLESEVLFVVENASQARFVEDLGGVYVQGSHYGRPVSADEFMVRLDSLGLTLG